MPPRRFLSAVLIFLVAALPALRAQRAPVEARHGMVASVHVLASEAGVEILRQGGNAVDAAVATGLALSAVYPFAGSLGGGGFMVIHLADGSNDGRGRQVIIDYREVAPAAATKDMFVGPDGKVLTGQGSSVLGWRAVGVPGNVAGFAHALEKYGSGKVTWAQVCEPARRLALGHTMSTGMAHNLRSWENVLGAFPESKRIFLNEGKFWAPGDRWVQADLAATLARLQQHGPREFYEGETARRFAAAMEQNGGLITLADLKAYRVVEREPLRGNYRGYEIVTMPPPSSGGFALLQMLAMLESHDVRALGQNSAAKYHLFTEIMKRTFRDRAEYGADPAFVPVPVDELLAPAYIAKRRQDIRPDRATPAAEVQPGLGAFNPQPVRRERDETTHFSVVDAAGNAVSNTFTLNGAYGSGATVPGTGIILNNEMDDFTAKPGTPNMYGLLQGEANAIAPGKRPLSSMTPTMVFKDGKFFLATGSPGGPTIITTVLQVVTNVIDHEMPVMAAVDAPRIHHQWMPDFMTHEPYGISPDTAALLRKWGHEIKLRVSYEGGHQGDAETVAVDPQTGVRLGAADPRKPDSGAVGY